MYLQIKRVQFNRPGQIVFRDRRARRAKSVKVINYEVVHQEGDIKGN